MSSPTLLTSAILGLAVLLGACLWWGYGATRRRFRRLVMASLTAQPPAPSRSTPPGLATLPEPVARYLDYTGALGSYPVENFRVRWTGRMRRGPDQPWFPIRAEQVNVLGEFMRQFYIEGRMFGLPVIGLDSYAARRGSMVMRALGIIPVVNSAGPEMATSGLITLFNDMCVLAPASLLDERIRWTPIDSGTARGTLRHGDLEVSAVIHVNARGELVNFVTHDRYRGGDGSYERLPWSTPLGEYRQFGGIRLASRGAGAWQMGDDQFVYAEFDLEQVTYNILALE